MTHNTERRQLCTCFATHTLQTQIYFYEQFKWETIIGILGRVLGFVVYCVNIFLTQIFSICALSLSHYYVYTHTPTHTHTRTLTQQHTHTHYGAHAHTHTYSVAVSTVSYQWSARHAVSIAELNNIQE